MLGMNVLNPIIAKVAPQTLRSSYLEKLFNQRFLAKLLQD